MPLLLVGLGVFYDVPDKSGRLVGVADELHAQVLAVLPSHPAGKRAMGFDRQEQLCAWNRLLDRLETLEYAPNNAFEHQPGIMLGTLELNLRFKKA